MVLNDGVQQFPGGGGLVNKVTKEWCYLLVADIGRNETPSPSPSPSPRRRHSVIIANGFAGPLVPLVGKNGLRRDVTSSTACLSIVRSKPFRLRNGAWPHLRELAVNKDVGRPLEIASW